MLQPFPQLAREIYHPSDEELGTAGIRRVAGLTIPGQRLFALQHRGWQWQGESAWIKPVAAGVWARLDVSPGMWMGQYDAPPQALGEVVLVAAAGTTPPALGALDPIAFSELVRDIEALR